ncbi:hypothetical protein C2E23DRAFT_889020 [Lenzites betulinus]|nr:hypothetical protein C2E23DRAFT_889020 [Lenzites betulinus]
MARHSRFIHARRGLNQVQRADAAGLLATVTSDLGTGADDIFPSASASALQATGHLPIPTVNVLPSLSGTASVAGIGGSVSPPIPQETPTDSSPSSPTITPSTPDDSDSTPSPTEAAPLTNQAPPPSPTPTDTPQPTATPYKTDIETSTSVIPVTSVINVSGTESATTVWMTPLSSALGSSQSPSNAITPGGVSSGEMIAIAVASVSLLSLLILGSYLWRRRKRARKSDDEFDPPYNGEYQFSPIEDPFKYRTLPSPISTGMSKRTASPLPIHAMHAMHRDADAAKPDESHPDDPTHGSSRPSSTLSYINSLCPETSAAHFPEPPAAHLPSSRPQTPQTPTTPRSYADVVPRPLGFRPLPLPVPISPLAAAHFGHPDERASVWSVMEVGDARGTVYETLVWHGDEVLQIGSPPEYSREG